MTLAAALVADLAAAGLTLATAESLTGGGLGHAITTVPGSSAVYVGGVVSYATRLKLDLLGVAEDLVAAHGVVSAECAAAMAVGARALLGADLALSTTGVAGPDVQEGRPVGLVYVAVAGPERVFCRELRLEGDRTRIREKSCTAALEQAASCWQDAVGGKFRPDR